MLHTLLQYEHLLFQRVQKGKSRYAAAKPSGPLLTTLSSSLLHFGCYALNRRLSGS